MDQHTYYMLKYNVAISTLITMLVANMIEYDVSAMPVSMDIVVEPEVVHTDNSTSITCFNEPAHPLGVNGILEVTAPDGSIFSKGETFRVGDFNGNGIQDNYLTVRFPDDFSSARLSHGEYIVFCQLWSGECECVEPGEINDNLNKAFWAFFYVNFNVLPESSIGMIAIVVSSIGVFSLYKYKDILLKRIRG